MFELDDISTQVKSTEAIMSDLAAPSADYETDLDALTLLPSAFASAEPGRLNVIFWVL
jgi:hypothetical protein